MKSSTAKSTGGKEHGTTAVLAAVLTLLSGMLQTHAQTATSEQKYPALEPQELIARRDVDKDGVVSRNEYLAPFHEESKRNEFIQRFELGDTNKDGFLTFEELMVMRKGKKAAAAAGVVPVENTTKQGSGYRPADKDAGAKAEKPGPVVRKAQEVSETKAVETKSNGSTAERATSKPAAGHRETADDIVVTLPDGTTVKKGRPCAQPDGASAGKASEPVSRGR